MNVTSGPYSIALILLAWSMLALGYVLGREREQPADDSPAEWHRHVQQALFVARPGVGGTPYGSGVESNAGTQPAGDDLAGRR